jgi:hypothetical protein|tara:strand:+ start:389 stop:583 length:195 start_codon:yes stop_codon:yes gene_type:complete
MNTDEAANRLDNAGWHVVWGSRRDGVWMLTVARKGHHGLERGSGESFSHAVIAAWTAVEARGDE